MYGTFVTRDLFFLFFFYELAVLPMYLLIGVWGSSSDFGTFIRTKEYGAMKLVLYLVAGSVLVWVSILAVYWAASQAGTPTFSLEELQKRGVQRRLQALREPLLPLLHGGIRGAGRPVALPHLVTRRTRGCPHRGEYAPRRGTNEAGGLRYHPCGHGPAARRGRYLDARAHRAGNRQRPLWSYRSHVSAGT